MTGTSLTTAVGEWTTVTADMCKIRRCCIHTVRRKATIIAHHDPSRSRTKVSISVVPSTVACFWSVRLKNGGIRVMDQAGLTWLSRRWNASVLEKPEKKSIEAYRILRGATDQLSSKRAISRTSTTDDAREVSFKYGVESFGNHSNKSPRKYACGSQDIKASRPSKERIYVYSDKPLAPLFAYTERSRSTSKETDVQMYL
jgi:hypothetical protein